MCLVRFIARRKRIRLIKKWLDAQEAKINELNKLYIKAILDYQRSRINIKTFSERRNALLRKRRMLKKVVGRIYIKDLPDRLVRRMAEIVGG